MSGLGPDFERAARRLGWELSPDLAAAEHAVQQRAAALVAARRRRRSIATGTGLVAALAVAITAAAVPSLSPRFGAVVRPIDRPGTAVPGTGAANSGNSLFPPTSQDGFVDIPEVGVGVSGRGQTGRQLPACSREDVTLETAFSREFYPPGESAVVTLVLRNASRAACGAQADPCTSRISVFNQTGVGVYSSVVGAHPYLCQAPDQLGPAQPVRQVLQPGQEMTMTFRWLGQSCSGAAFGPSCAPVIPGRYTVTGDWAGFPTAGSGPAVLAPDYCLTTLPRHLTIA